MKIENRLLNGWLAVPLLFCFSQQLQSSSIIVLSVLHFQSTLAIHDLDKNTHLRYSFYVYCVYSCILYGCRETFRKPLLAYTSRLCTKMARIMSKIQNLILKIKYNHYVFATGQRHNLRSDSKDSFSE